MSGQFYIIRLLPDNTEQPVDNYGPYDDGKQAALVAKQLTMDFGIKHQPRRMAAADPDAWKARETKRMSDGTYKPFPKLWDKVKLPPEHFAHICPKDQTKIAYFPDNDSGILDRPTVTTPGRYLKTIDPTIGDLPLKDLIAAIDNMTDVKFATTRADIRRVYENGPSSCMQGKASKYNRQDIHPAEAYAAGDLAIAYLESKGKISARVLAHPGRKHYGTIYGDKARLEAQLIKLGYKYMGLFDPGVKVAKIPLKDAPYSYILPYFDNMGQMQDLGEVFETAITRGGSPDPTKLKDGILVTGGSSGGTGNASRHCPKNKNFQHAGGKWQEVHVSKDKIETWSESAVSYHSLVYKLPDGGTQRWDKEQCVEMRDGHNNINHVPRAYLNEVGFQCWISKNYYVNAELAETDANGRKIAKASLKRKAEAEARKAREEVEFMRYKELLLRERQKSEVKGVFDHIEPKVKPRKTPADPVSAVRGRPVINIGGSSLTGSNAVRTTFIGNSASVSTSNEEAVEWA